MSTYLGFGLLGFGCVNNDRILVGRMLGLLKLKRDGLSDNKANLSPAKLKLADIGLELSLAIECSIC